eukprot:12398574-Karenia_brevis.AAC.1
MSIRKGRRGTHLQLSQGLKIILSSTFIISKLFTEYVRQVLCPRCVVHCTAAPDFSQRCVMSKTDIPGVEGESGDLTKKSQKHPERSSDATRDHVQKTRE